MTFSPPGCFLSAVEILRRQYLAHLLDLAGAGQLRTPDAENTVHPLPRLATALFGRSGWLNEFRAPALAEGPRLVDMFLGLLPAYDEERGTGVSPEATEALRAFATRSPAEAPEGAETLIGAFDRAEARWSERRGEMQRRIAAIDRTNAELVAGDPEHQRRARELRAERRAVDQWERTDRTRHKRELQRARSLLFVAVTRARDALAISWNGEPSRFLKPLRATAAGRNQ